MNSVLHIRIDSPSYKSDAIERGFIANNFRYNSINWQQLRFSYGIEEVRKRVIETARQLKPTIIFCHLQNAEIFDLYTWKELSKYGFVINYTFDVRFADKIEWMYDAAKFIGHTFFACMEDVGNCKIRGIENVSQLHSSCDMELFKPLCKNIYAFDVVFCGNRYDNTNLNFPLAEERQRMIELLEEKYYSRFMCYGLGQKGGLIQPEVEANVYNFSRIAINQNNFNLNGYTSDRLWRIMSSGTFCLTKYFKGIEDIFEKGVDLDWWSTFDELISLIDFYLGDDAERLAVAKNGTNKVRKNHTWADRILSIIKTCDI